MLKTVAIKKQLKTLVLVTLLTASVYPVGAETYKDIGMRENETVDGNYSAAVINQDDVRDIYEVDKGTDVGYQAIFTVNGDSSTTVDSSGRAIGLNSEEGGVIKLNGEKNTFDVTGYGQDVYGISMTGDYDTPSGEDRLHVMGDTTITVNHKGYGQEPETTWRDRYTFARGIVDDSKGQTIFDGNVDITVTGSSETPWLDGILQRGVEGGNDSVSNTLIFNNDVNIHVSADVLDDSVGDNALTGVQLLSRGGDNVTEFNGKLNITVNRPGDAMVIGIYNAIDSDQHKSQIGNFNGDVTINSTGYGIQSRYGTLNFNAAAEIIAGQWGVYVPGGNVEFNNDLIVRPQGDRLTGKALRTDNDGAINVNTGKDSEVQIDGGIESASGSITANLSTDTSFITGDLSSWNGGIVDVNIDGKGVLTGSSDIIYGWGTVNVGLVNGARWNVTGTDNVLTTLNLGQNSIVNLANGKLGQTITMDNLVGNGGTFLLDIDVRQNSMNATNDRIYVNNTFSNETAQIALADVNGSGTLTDDTIGTVLATTKNKNSDNVVNQGRFLKVDVETPLHWFDYQLEGIVGKDYTDWVIVAPTDSPESVMPPDLPESVMPPDSSDPDDPPAPIAPPDSPDPDDPITPIVPSVPDNPPERPTTTTDTIKSSAISSYYLWRDNDKLMQRLGDLRQSKNEDQGIWARIIRNDTEYDNNAYFHNNTSTMQLGYDKVVSRDAKDNYWVAGGAIGYLNGSGSYHYGSGDHSGTTFSLYGTRMGSKGHYLDLVAKAGKYNHHFNSYMIDGTPEKGDYDTLGYSISAEYGRKTPLNSGWYVEPQIQLTLGRLNSTDYVTMNGVKVNQDGINSAIGRIGFNIGRNVGKNTNFYLKANLNHEFGGRGHVSMSTGNDSRDEEFSLDDTWFTYGLGVAATIGKNSHLYFDIERSSGSDFTTDWQWNVGMRFKV